MTEKKRLLGIDLCRGIASYAVILVHSGDETWGITTTQTAIQFRSLFYFAVPFFLATSFYFMAGKSKINTGHKFWKSRIERILIPYIIWSTLYVTLKLIIFPLTNQTEQIKTILQDPLAIIFFGGASYHLYFLPLLFIGSFLLFLAKYLKEKQIKLIFLILLSLLSILTYQFLLWSDNSFLLGSNIAFARLLNLLQSDGMGYSFARIMLVVVAWILRCLPYLLIAITIKNLSKKICFKFNNKLIFFFSISCFLLINILGAKNIPEAFWEITIAYSLLFFAIALSSFIKLNPLIINLGKCSFGIYLIHPFVKSAVEIIVDRVIPLLNSQVSIISILVYSLLTFFSSWFIVLILIKNKLIAQYIFGA